MSDKNYSLPIIDYAVMTVSRPHGYIHHLLNHFRPDLALRLVVGSPECSYLQRYRSNPFIEMVVPTPSEWEEIKNSAIHHRAAWNYWRTLYSGTRNLARQGMVVFEDDVAPARNWENRLFDIIEQIEAQSLSSG
jgi:hypothetical protein